MWLTKGNAILQEHTFKEDRHMEIRIKIKKHIDIINLGYDKEVINIGQGKPGDWKRDSRNATDYIT